MAKKDNIYTWGIFTLNTDHLEENLTSLFATYVVYLMGAWMAGNSDLNMIEFLLLYMIFQKHLPTTTTIKRE